MRKDLYCDEEFIDKLICSPPLVSACDENSLRKHQCWTDFCMLLLNSNLHLNIDEETLTKKIGSNLFYKQLVKRQSDGLCKLSPEGSNALNLDQYSFSSNHSFLNGLFLVSCNRIKAETLSQKYGILFIPYSDYTSYSFLFKDTGPSIPLKDTNIYSWDFLRRDKKNICNSMIIIDNFLLNDKDKMIEDLSSIFESLLPDSLDGITFQLAIYAILNNNNNEDIPIKKRYDDIMDILKEKTKSGLTVSLTIYKCKHYRFEDPKRFHGRVIITNDYIINSDGGLDLFKDGKSTKLAIVNIVYPNITKDISWASNAYEDYLKEAKIEADESELYDENQPYLGGRHIGNKEMRLWKLIQT